MPTNKGQKSPKRPLIFYYAVTLIVLMLLNWLFFPSLLSRQVTEIGYDELVSMVDDGKVETVSYDSQDHEIVFEAKDDKGKTAIYKTGIFPDDALVDRLLKGNVKFAAEIPTQASPLVSMLVSYIVPIVLIIAVGQWLQKKMMKNMGGNMMSFGKSGAKIYAESETGKTFADVAGQDEAKEALTEIVDFLHNPNRYAAIGAKLPKGALLVGPPGTGKTLLAKAVAGEAHVPFFSISGSEFVEMFVGMGAAKVRDLFKQAGEKAPCIVFIDEIDTIGKKRDGAGMGGNDEREQTLNQLLTEMDGFDGTKGVVILAATNRPESLDPALLRPGRFDRRIPVQLPDLQGRIAILKVHAKDVHMTGHIDFNAIARATSGASGADLANIINEAALRAVRLGRSAVEQADLEESVETVIAGAQRKGEGDRLLSRDRPRARRGQADQLCARHQDHHRSAHLGRARLHHAGGRGRAQSHDAGRAAEQARHTHRRPCGRGADLRLDHDRRVQRHRAGDQARTRHDHPLRHEPQIRHGRARDRYEPVSFRRHYPCLLG